MNLFSFIKIIIKSKINIYTYTFFLFLLCLNVKTQSGFEIPKKPRILYPIQDYANIFNYQEKYILNTNLFEYKKQTSNEILIITIPTLNNDDINLIAAIWGEKWKIGEQKKNNGIIFLIAIKEKKVSIQVGRSLEYPITDAMCKKIIENCFKPYAKENNFYKATITSINAIQKILSNKNTNKVINKNKKKNKNIFILLLVILIIILLKNRNKDEDSDDYNNSIKKRKYLNLGFLDFNINNDDRSSNDGFGSGGSFGGGGANGSW